MSGILAVGVRGGDHFDPGDRIQACFQPVVANMTRWPKAHVTSNVPPSRIR